MAFIGLIIHFQQVVIVENYGFKCGKLIWRGATFPQR